MNNVLQAIVQLKDRKGSSIKDIQKKLNLFSKSDIKKLKALLFDAVNNTNMLNKTNGRYKIVTQTSANSDSATASSVKPPPSITGVTSDELKQLDTIHDFGHATKREAYLGLSRMFPQGTFSFLLDLNLGNVDSNSQLKKICSTSSTEVKKRSVSYERRANAKADNCAMENAWTEGSFVTWEDIILRNVDPSTIESDILIIQNGNNYNYAFKNALRREVGLVSGTNIKKMTARNIVGGFILNYMFPGYAENNGNAPIGVTYDAAGRKITKLFSGLGQVKASITPENIADSASTMLDPFKKFKQYGHKRTDFIFPENSAGSGNWEYTSQFFSQDIFKIVVKNRNFNVNNPNGFVIEIYDKSDNSLIFTINYDTWVKNIPMGPSAPYLAGLIETIAKLGSNSLNTLKTSLSLRPKSNIIPLLPLIESLFQKNFTPKQIITLLFDLKRTGDYEQANAAKKLLQMDPDTNIILGTGDILCSTYARSIGQPCALDGTGGSAEALILFRFPNTAPPVIAPEIEELIEINKKIKFCIENYEILTNYKELIRKLNNIKDQFDYAGSNGKYKVYDPTSSLNEKESENISDFFGYLIMKNCRTIYNKIFNENIYKRISVSFLTNQPIGIQIYDHSIRSVTGQARKKNINVGMKIIEINGVDVSKFDDDKLIDYISSKKKEGPIINITFLTHEVSKSNIFMYSKNRLLQKQNSINIFIKNLKGLTSQQIQSNKHYQNSINVINKTNSRLSKIIDKINNIIDMDNGNILSKISEFYDDVDIDDLSILDENGYFKPTSEQNTPFFLALGYDINTINKIASKMVNFFIRIPMSVAPLEQYVIRYFSGENTLDILTEILKSQSIHISFYIGEIQDLMYDGVITAKEQFAQGININTIINNFKEVIINKIEYLYLMEPEEEKKERNMVNQETKKLPTPSPKTKIISQNDQDVAMSGGDLEDIMNFKNNLYEGLEVLASKCSEIVTDKVNYYFTTLPPNENKQKAVFQIYSILFNFYKIMNRYLNACRTISDQNGNIILTLTTTSDLNTSLITLTQQIAFYKSQFGTNTSISENQNIKNQIDNVFQWVINNTPYIQNPGSRGRRRAAIQTEIVKLMNNLNIQTTTITPISVLQFLQLLQVLLSNLLQLPLDNSGLTLTQIFINIHQGINSDAEDFKESIMLSWSDTLTYGLEDAPGINYSFTNNNEIVYPEITTSSLTFINQISSFLMDKNNNNIIISTLATLNNVFQTTSITFDPITALNPSTFQQMGFTISSTSLNSTNFQILTGKLDINNAPFKQLENVNQFIQLAFNDIKQNIPNKSNAYITSLNNGSILFDPMIVEVPESVFSNANYLGSGNDPLFLYIYPIRLGQYRIPDSNNFAWNLNSPLRKNILIQGGKKKSKKRRRRRKRSRKHLAKRRKQKLTKKNKKKKRKTKVKNRG